MKLYKYVITYEVVSHIELEKPPIPRHLSYYVGDNEAVIMGASIECGDITKDEVRKQIIEDGEDPRDWADWLDEDESE